MSTHTIDFANGESFNLEFDSDAHQYRLAESGEVVPSATQILSIIAKPALIYWAAYEGSKYFKKQVVELVNGVSTPQRAGDLPHEWGICPMTFRTGRFASASETSLSS